MNIMGKAGNNFNKDVQMHLACGTDRLRPIMSNIYFKDGFAYATDTHVLVKNKISEISGISGDDIALLDGKLIHADVFKQILKYDLIQQIKEDGIECAKNGSSAFFKFSNAEGVFPNAEKVLKSCIEGKHKATEMVGLDLNLVGKLNKALFCNGRCIFTFNGKNGAIVAKPINEESSCIGVITPFYID